METETACCRLRLRLLEPAAAAAERAGTGWLSDDERRRLAGIGAAAGRRRYLAGHWLAREVLASVAGGQPADWRLLAPDGGKPRAVHRDGRPGPFLSLSHSGGWLACAAGSTSLGIDLEHPSRERDLIALADTVCSQREREALLASEGAVRESLFYRCWTLKEAWLKRTGVGIAPARLRQIAFAPANPQEATALTWQAPGLWLALAVDPGIAPAPEDIEGLRATGLWQQVPVPPPDDGPEPAAGR